MSEKIDPTWLAYALDEPVDPVALDAALERVRGHYDTLVDYPTESRDALGARLGVAVIGDAEPRCRWPFFAAGDGLVVASAYALAGWRQMAGAAGLDAAPLAIGRAVAASPEQAAAKLPAPFALAVLEPEPIAC